MTLKNILVHLDQTPRSSVRYELALTLAERHEARLTAYFASSASYYSKRGERQLREENLEICREKAAEAGVAFDCVEPDEAEIHLPLATRLSHQAAYADLCIVGQPAKELPTPRDLPERLIMVSGHPVMTIPFAGTFPDVGRRVMVAWKAGRASARAVLDALPFLRGAEEVTLISLSTDEAGRKENEGTLRRLAGYLECHGVEAKTENRTVSNIAFGDALLNRAADEAVDLLVCGGMVAPQLGPLPDHLLQQMTVPVLMSS